MESTLKKQITKYLKQFNVFSFNYNPWMGLNGMTDILLIVPGYQLICIETKGKGKNVTPVQLNVHKKLRDAGAYVFVVRSKQDLIDMLDFYNIKLFEKEKKK